MDSKHTSGALNVAVNAALEAGKFVAQSITKLDRIKVSQKSASELVSEIDVVAEQRIVELLDEAYPGFNVIAEESGDLARDSEFCWVIDPLDGTHNFLHGQPHFAVSIALKSARETLLGVVFDPLRNELFSARRGAGAQLDNHRIRVSTTTRLSDSLLCADYAPGNAAATKQWLKAYATVLPRVQSIHRSGSSVLDLAWLAAGRYDGIFEFGLREWDLAAGALLVEEAGGLITDVRGGAELSSGSIVAGAPKIHDKLSQLIGAAVR